MNISVRLPKEMGRALTSVARSTDRPRSYLVIKALGSYLEDHADYQVALDRLRDKDDEVISSSELRRRIASHKKG
jgi:RHH-type rel operon transcriptional repressor/antitoxin RelB